MIAVVSLTVAAVGALVVAANAANKQAEALQGQLLDAINRGDTVLPNSDGTYWIISNQDEVQS